MTYNRSISNRRREYVKPRCDSDHRPNCSDLHSTPRLNAWRSWMQLRWKDASPTTDRSWVRVIKGLRDPSQPGTSSWVVLDRAAPVQLTMLGLLHKSQLLLKVWSLGTRSSSRQRDPKPCPPDRKRQKVVMVILSVICLELRSSVGKGTFLSSCLQVVFKGERLPFELKKLKQLTDYWENLSWAHEDRDIRCFFIIIFPVHLKHYGVTGSLSVHRSASESKLVQDSAILYSHHPFLNRRFLFWIS